MLIGRWVFVFPGGRGGLPTVGLRGERRGGSLRVDEARTSPVARIEPWGAERQSREAVETG